MVQYYVLKLFPKKIIYFFIIAHNKMSIIKWFQQLLVATAIEDINALKEC